MKDSTERLQLVDKLGYSRYWYAEHHNKGRFIIGGIKTSSQKGYRLLAKEFNLKGQ